MIETGQCYLAISYLRDETFQDLPFMINGTPEITLLAVDLHKSLVQMPSLG